MWHHLRGNKQACKQYKIYCRALLQQRNNGANTNLLTFYAKVCKEPLMEMINKSGLFLKPQGGTRDGSKSHQLLSVN